VTIVQRWDRKEHKHVQVSCPAIVKEYNEHMGEVDVFDMLMSLYKVDHKSTEWHIRIFFWALNVAIINGWLLYRRHCQQLQQPICIQQDLVEFTSAISEALIHQNKLPQVVVCKNTSTLSSIRGTGARNSQRSLSRIVYPSMSPRGSARTFSCTAEKPESPPTLHMAQRPTNPPPNPILSRISRPLSTPLLTLHNSS